MLNVSFGVLSVAVALGLALAVLRVRPGGGSARLGLLHGGLGAIGLAALLFALRDRVLGALAWDAVALLTAAFLAGATFLALARRGRPPGLLLALHAALALIGYVLLAAYIGSK